MSEPGANQFDFQENKIYTVNINLFSLIALLLGLIPFLATDSPLK